MPFFPQRAIGIRGSGVGTIDELHGVVSRGREGWIPPVPLDMRPLTPHPRRWPICAPATSAAASSSSQTRETAGPLSEAETLVSRTRRRRLSNETMAKPTRLPPKIEECG
jgi:hypothetical protein